MLVKEIMTHNVEVVSPSDTLEQTAKKMEELNVGLLAVCEGNRVVGIITDRDITAMSGATRRPPWSTTRCRRTSSAVTTTRTLGTLAS